MYDPTKALKIKRANCIALFKYLLVLFLNLSRKFFCLYGFLFLAVKCDFHDAVTVRCEKGVSISGLGKIESVSYERRSVKFALGYERQNFLCVTAVHAARFEREIFSDNITQPFLAFSIIFIL